MAYGFEIRNTQNQLVISVGNAVGRVIGTGKITFTQNQFTSKSVVIPGLVNSDSIFVQDSGNIVVIYNVSRNGQTVTLNRTSALAGDPSTHLIVGVRF